MAENLKATESTNAWLVASQELDLKSGNTAAGEKITLQTAGKWLDRNIEIAAPTAKIDNASVESGNANITTVKVGDKANGAYAVTGAATVAGPNVITPGYISVENGTKTAGEATVNATIVAGELTASVVDGVNGSAEMAAEGFTASEEATKYVVNLSTSAGSAKAKADVKSAGYVKDETETSIAVNVEVDGDGDKLYLPVADVEAAVVETTKPIVEVSGAGNNIKTSDSATDFYVEVSAEQKSAGLATANVSTTGVGMVAADTADEATVDIDAALQGSGSKVYIQPAVIGSAAGTADLTAFPETSTTMVATDGYLTIAEGYIKGTKISLADIIPDEANITPSTGTGQILEGVSAYDKDGKLIVGTIATKTKNDMTANDATVTAPAGYYAEDAQLTIATDTITYAEEEQAGDFEVESLLTDQTITVAKGWEPGRTITVKGAENAARATLGAEGTAEATVATLTVGASNLEDATVAISGSQAISGTASASTATSGFAKAGETAATGDITGTAAVDATLPLFVGDYILG